MLTAGQRFERERALSQADFDAFAALSGDDNPIHVDPAFAARTRFGRTVSHGMLLYALIGAALAEFAPAARVETQELLFPAPTYAGVPLCISLLVSAASAGEAELETTISAAGVLVCAGRARLRWEAA